MKLRKQAPAKALLIAATAGLLAGFFALVRSEPRIKASTEPAPATPVINYDRVFVPNQPPSGTTNPLPAPDVRPHTRTRAS